MKTMLLVFAHPDDESFTAGGTVAKYAKTGWKIHLVCATNGEQAGDDLGPIRQKEVRKAADTLGIKSVTFLGLPDAGLSELTPGTLEDPLFKIMKEKLPDTVITHDTTGITNHPDHIKVCYAVTYAFQEYAEYLFAIETKNKSAIHRGKNWIQEEHQRVFGDVAVSHEPKLYYVCLPQNILAFFKKVGGLSDLSYDQPWKGTPDKTITTVIDIKQTKSIKIKALKCHLSQKVDVDRFIAVPLLNPFLKQEFFLLRMQGTYEILMGKIDRIDDRL